MLPHLVAKTEQAVKRNPTVTGSYNEDPSERELAVLRLLPGDLTQREIAERLHVSFNTVKSHTKSIFRKLGVTSRRDAVREARRPGLL